MTPQRNGSDREVLVTCGNQSDPRIRLRSDVVDALTFIFRSDSNNQQHRGVELRIIEINATAANVSNNVYYLLSIHMSICHYSCTMVMVVCHEEGDLKLMLLKD